MSLADLISSLKASQRRLENKILGTPTREEECPHRGQYSPVRVHQDSRGAERIMVEQLNLATIEDKLMSVEQDGTKTDLHKLKAARLFDLPYEKITPEQRRIGKQANYIDLYQR